jgi:hypothetical protein
VAWTQYQPDVCFVKTLNSVNRPEVSPLLEETFS